MPGEIFDFEWYVHTEGYEWVTADSAGDSIGFPLAVGDDAASGKASWLVVAGAPSSQNIIARRKYLPLREYSCLFRIFAETKPDPGGITAFADKYGLLGVELETTPGRYRPFIGTSEPGAFWESEIKTLRSALTLWDMVSANDKQALKDYLHPRVDLARADIDEHYSASGRSAEPLGAADAGELRWFRTHPGLIGDFDNGDFELIALDRVQAIVNERLMSRVSPRILWDERPTASWGLYFVPDSLIGAIWIQFAQAITENRDYRRCRQCDSWFEIDHYKARTNRYFCSNACRSKAYRKRQQAARNMAESGSDLEEIALELGSDVNTVSKWIQ